MFAYNLLILTNRVVYCELNMKVLVAYMSQTGNTKKVAEAIYSVIPQPKEIKRVEMSHHWMVMTYHS